MAKLPQEAIDLLSDLMVPKVLATSSTEGVLNVCPKGTLSALDDETVIFADILGIKTNENLEVNDKVALAAFRVQVPPVGYQIKGRFAGFQREGELFDKVAAKVKKAINMDTRAVGVIEVDEVYSCGVPEPGAKLA
jgi:predicted pyridoxine 5'-phosphate oxidase superfamily flavin-nucleotide-binding protein